MIHRGNCGILRTESMPLKDYLLLMSIATGLAWGTWVYVLVQVDPQEAGLIWFALFYVTLFASAVGTLAIFGSLYRIVLRKRRHLVAREVRIAFRHAVMVSAAAMVALVLSTQNLLSWVTLAFLFGTVGLLEYLFLLVQESRRE